MAPDFGRPVAAADFFTPAGTPFPVLFTANLDGTVSLLTTSDGRTFTESQFVFDPLLLGFPSALEVDAAAGEEKRTEVLSLSQHPDQQLFRRNQWGGGELSFFFRRRQDTFGARCELHPQLDPAHTGRAGSREESRHLPVREAEPREGVARGGPFLRKEGE